MKFEKLIASFSYPTDGQAYEELIAFAKKYGKNENNIEDSIELTKVPEFLLGRIEEQPVIFDYFILSGYHGSRYGKNRCELHEVYRKDDQG